MEEKSNPVISKKETLIKKMRFLGFTFLIAGFAPIAF
jgi:hypothetical protein